jgi:hypothetical protein
VNPESVQPSFLNDDNRKRFPSPRKRLLSKLREACQQHTKVPAGTLCFDIFSPPPGDNDVISQVERLSSNEMKIAPTSLRMALGASGAIIFMAISRVGDRARVVRAMAAPEQCRSRCGQDAASANAPAGAAESRQKHEWLTCADDAALQNILALTIIIHAFEPWGAAKKSAETGRFQHLAGCIAATRGASAAVPCAR